MSMYTYPWEQSAEPSSSNVSRFMDALWLKLAPFEQARWSQGNIDSLFYAGDQAFINRYYGFNPVSTNQNFYFNISAPVIQLVTGYQRQHRKTIQFTATKGGDAQTTDQYTALMMQSCLSGDVYETFSKACEHAAVTGMCLLQPYLDFSGEDPAQGSMKVKLWEFNSFCMDPFWRNNIDEANVVWTQEYISRKEAAYRFPKYADQIRMMSSASRTLGRFYFLPENYNTTQTDLLIVSYIWYKWKRKKKMIYSRTLNQFFDVTGDDNELIELTQTVNDFEEVEIEVPTWKVAVVLNDKLVYQGLNPLKTDACPFVPVYWNYSPEIGNNYDLRVRGLQRAMRSSQWLMNRRVILNHEIAETTINAGWKRKIGAVANEDNLKQVGQGYDIIVNEGYELSDVEKIVPSGVPDSNLALAEQLRSLLHSTAGIDIENWAGQVEKGISTLTAMLKQAANLTVLQKFFDQWDHSLMQLGDLMLQIMLLNWSPAKIKMMLNEEPTPFFYSRIMTKYRTVVQEGILTPTQQTMQAQQLLDINQAFGREVFPPSFVVDKLNIQGKADAMRFLQQQEEMQSVQSQQQALVSQVTEEAKLKETMARTVNLLAQARANDSKSQAEIGMFEERVSQIMTNRALATKAKMEALEKLMDVIGRYGELETMLQTNQLQSFDYRQMLQAEDEKRTARNDQLAMEFANSMRMA